MKLLSLTPLLRTTDMAVTIDFYTHQLGFVCKSYREEWGWAVVVRDGIEIMPAIPNAHEPFATAALRDHYILR